MTEKEAIHKRERAKSASVLVELWLEHPWVAHDLHEQAASACEQLAGADNDTAEIFKNFVVEHHAAAQHFARLELNWSKWMGYNQRDSAKLEPESRTAIGGAFQR